MPSARQTLFWKYAAYFTGLVSVLLVVSGSLGGYFAYQQSTAALEELQRAKAQFAADDIANFIGRVEEALQSTVAKFTGRAVDAEDLRIELIGLLRHQPSITELHWVEADGAEGSRSRALPPIPRTHIGIGRAIPASSRPVQVCGMCRQCIS